MALFSDAVFVKPGASKRNVSRDDSERILVAIKISGPPGNRTPITCMQNKRLTIRRVARVVVVNLIGLLWRLLKVKVVEVGVEPTKSPRSQRDRFACLRTRPFAQADWSRFE